MSGLRLALHEFRYDQKVFWRNPASVFFTVILPLIFLFIFATIFGNDEIESRGVKTTTYYVPAIVSLAVISATLQSLAINLAQDRERGLLKRVRGTPLPTAFFVSGRVGNSLVVSILMVLLVSVIGRLVYGVSLPDQTTPAVLLTLVVGAFSFCCLGFALTAIIPSEEAAPAISNATVLPLYFISGIFIPDSEIPNGVLHFANLFPIRHFFEAFFAAWDPNTAGSGIELGHLAVVLAWGIFGLIVALRYFRWEPRR
jgi:ABC-2 type transport system permease protein